MDEAHDGKGAAACPPSPAPRQPRRLLPHPGEMMSVVRPGLGLDRDGDPPGRDRHRVDVPPALPRQRMAQPPAISLERFERALDGVLRARPDPTPTSEREPVARVETQPDGRENQQPAERRRSRARDHEPEQRGDGASQRRLAGAREPAILLATRVVHAAIASRSRPAPNAISHSVGSATSRSSHRCQTVPGTSVPDRATTLRLPALGEIGPRLDRAASHFYEICRAFASTATGIRTRVSAVRGRRPSPLDDSGGVWNQQVFRKVSVAVREELKPLTRAWLRAELPVERLA
jgi:hypothetical protein